jgi:hypothetical protein
MLLLASACGSSTPAPGDSNSGEAGGTVLASDETVSALGVDRWSLSTSKDGEVVVFTADGLDAEGEPRDQLKIRLNYAGSGQAWLELSLTTEPPVVARIVRNADGSSAAEGAEGFQQSKQAQTIVDRLIADLRAASQTGPAKAQGLRPLCGLVCGPLPLFRDPSGWAQCARRPIRLS